MLRTWLTIGMLLAALPVRAAESDTDSSSETVSAEDTDAQGVRLDELAPIRRALAEVAPVVCEIVGKCTEHLPSVAAMTTEEARTLLVELRVEAYRAEGRPHPVRDAERDVEQELTSVAFYMPAQDVIIVQSDKLERGHDVGRLTAAEADLSLRGLLAHEYTHAVQAAHVPLSDDRSTRVMQAVLREAFANLVEQLYCEREASRELLETMDRLQALEVAFPMDDAERARLLAYRHGRDWMLLTVLNDGMEAAWAAQVEPPLTPTELHDWAVWTRTPAWIDPSAMGELARRWIRAYGRTPAEDPLTALGVMDVVAGETPELMSESAGWRWMRTLRADLPGVPVAHSGWGIAALERRGPVPVRGQAVAVLVFHTEAEAASLITKREEYAVRQEAEAELSVVGKGFHEHGRAKDLEKLGADQALAVRRGREGFTQERWGRWGNVVVLALSVDQKVGDQELADVVHRTAKAAREHAVDGAIIGAD